MTRRMFKEMAKIELIYSDAVGRSTISEAIWLNEIKHIYVK